MRRLFLILSILALTAMGVSAENISQKQAMQMAQTFFNAAWEKTTAPPKLVYNGKRLTTNRLFTPFYVYNTPLGGFVIISADNKAYPILGFSLKNSFDPDKLEEAELGILGSYAREIEYVRYDTEPIENTIWAWQNFPEYVGAILTAPYVATDPLISLQEASENLDAALESDDIVDSYIYTPLQWRDMINDELQARKSVALGVIRGENVVPAVIYGRQGQYYRIELSERNSWLMRLNATEVIPSNMLTVVGNPIVFPQETEEIIPFEEHDSFLSEIRRNEEERHQVSSIDIPLLADEPVVIALGGGHYEVYLPEEVAVARVYNLSGSLVRRHSYHDTQRAYIDISAEPSGFYIVNLTDIQGRPYGFKLSR